MLQFSFFLGVQKAKNISICISYNLCLFLFEKYEKLSALLVTKRRYCDNFNCLSGGMNFNFNICDEVSGLKDKDTIDYIQGTFTFGENDESVTPSVNVCLSMHSLDGTVH